MKGRLLPAFVMLGLLSVSACTDSTTTGGNTGSSGNTKTSPALFTDIPYATVSSAEKLDLALPAGYAPLPLVIYIHGGGYNHGDKAQPFENGLADQLLSEGYAVASLNYRLSGEATFPAAVNDLKAAVRWLRAHAAEYGLDPLKFSSWGDSAGANLASMLGTSCGVADLEAPELGNSGQSSCVQATVDWYGPTDGLLMDEESIADSCAPFHNKPGSPESQYLGGPIQMVPEIAEAADPITYVTSDDPPFFIQHGTEDCTVPYQQSQLLYDALAPAIGADNVTLMFLEGFEHGDPRFVEPSNVTLVLDFLDDRLK